MNFFSFLSTAKEKEAKETLELRVCEKLYNRTFESSFHHCGGPVIPARCLSSRGTKVSVIYYISIVDLHYEDVTPPTCDPVLWPADER